MISVTDILIQGRPATRDQLHALFKSYVCDTMCEQVLFDFTETELKRLVSIYIYRKETKGKRNNKSRVRRIICRAIGLSTATIYNYIPAEKNN